MVVLKMIRGLALSVALGAGILAVVHFESPVDGSRSVIRAATSRVDWRQNYSSGEVVVEPGKASGAVARELKRRMAEDELLGRSPFANLNAADVLDKVVEGAKAFERQTLRSPSYRDEAGYDLVHYEILHEDGSLSRVLAYLANDEETSESSVVVMVMSPQGDSSQYAQFEGGDLIEVKTVPNAEAENRIAEHLASGVPFLSVSR